MVERAKTSDFYFSPESELWKINRWKIIGYAGGQRASLLQLAHPLVAQGIYEWSDISKDPLRRLKEIGRIMSSLTFGTREEVLENARHINNTHKLVKGTLKQDIGIYKTGTPYDASDPKLIDWVWRTLVDTSLLVHQKFVGRVPDHEKELYYQEMKKLLALLGGIPQEAPTSIKDFFQSMRDMFNNGNLVVSQEAKTLVPFVRLDQLPNLKIPSSITFGVAIGLLPESIRSQYGFSWNTRKQTLLDTTAATSRLVYPHILPDRVRFFARYRNARKKS